MTRTPEILIIGGGPAGLTAAAAAAGRGAVVTLVDERTILGGQLTYRVQAIEPGSGEIADRPANLADRLMAEAVAAGASLRPDALVAGIYGGREVAIVESERAWSCVPDAVIVATGSTDLPYPFSGATYPGVLARRAVQILVNQHRVLPGRKVAIIGAGSDADELEIDILLAGGEVVWKDVAPAPMLRAEGRQGVEALAVGPALIPTDIIAIAVGRQADVSVATMAGAALSFAPELGGWVPLADRQMRCPETDVFVAGDAAGVGSVGAAISEGRLAGIAAAAFVGLANERDIEATRERGGQELAWRLEMRAQLEPTYAQPYA